MMPTYELISSVNAGAGTLTNISFSSIPQTYTDLMFIFSLRLNTGTNVGGYLNINGTVSSAPRAGFNANGSLSSEINNLTGFASSSGYTANAFSNGYVYVPNYTASANKQYIYYAGTGNTASAGYLGWAVGQVLNTSPTTTMTLGNETLAPYSTGYLYGIKKT
jgi:hypothetical protein